MENQSSYLAQERQLPFLVLFECDGDDGMNCASMATYYLTGPTSTQSGILNSSGNFDLTFSTAVLANPGLYTLFFEW